VPAGWLVSFSGGVWLTVCEHDFLHPLHVDWDSSFTHGKRVNVNAYQISSGPLTTWQVKPAVAVVVIIQE